MRSDINSLVYNIHMESSRTFYEHTIFIKHEVSMICNFAVVIHSIQFLKFFQSKINIIHISDFAVGTLLNIFKTLY